MKTRRLDAGVEDERFGRSDVSIRAAGESLRRARIRKVAEGYWRAYGGGKALGKQWAGWEDEGSWPEK